MISVLMTAKNEMKYIGESIQSIVDQTYEGWQLIVVDDCSTDDTEKIVREFMKKDPRVLYKRNLEEKGRTKNLNIGLKISKGDYIAYQCADDISYPKRFKEQLKCFKRNTGIVTTHGIAINSEGERIKDWYMDEAQRKTKPEILLNARNDWWVLGASLMIKKECFDKVGGFDNECYFAQDLNLWRRILNHYDFEICRMELLKNRRHPKKDKKNYNYRTSKNWHEVAIKKALECPIIK